MKKFISGLLAATLLTMPVCAAELSAEYNAVQKKYVISGSVPEAVQNGLVSIKVISDDYGTKGWVGTLHTDENGTFSQSFVFAPTAEGGDYTVSAGILESGVVKTTHLFYVTEAQKTTALTAVNDAIDDIKTAVSQGAAQDVIDDAYAALDNAITANAQYLGVNMTLYNSLGDAKDELLEILAEGTYTEPEDFIVALEENTAYALIKSADETTITAVMDEYFTSFALETSALYNEFLTLDKNSVYAKIAGEDLRSAAEVKAAFEAAVALTIINNASTWSEFQTQIDIYIGYTGIGTEYYDKCNKENLAAALCDNDYTKPQQLYDDIKTYWTNNENTTATQQGDGKAPGLTVSGTMGGGMSWSNESKEETEETALYSDMTGFEWADTAVTVLAEKGIVSGDGSGKFKPADYITREEFVKILLPAFGLYDDGFTSDFSDVDKNNWAYPYISCAYELGIVKGINGDLFGYGERITRQDMAVLIERAALIAGIELEKKNEVALTDIDALSDYAKESVLKMVEAGIINGYEDGSFRPVNEATRAEAAVMIYRILSR